MAARQRATGRNGNERLFRTVREIFRERVAARFCAIQADLDPPTPPALRGDRGSRPGGRRDLGAARATVQPSAAARGGRTLASRVTGQPERGCQAGVRRCRSGGHITRRPFLVNGVEACTPARPLRIPLRFHRAGCYKESELLGLLGKTMRCAKCGTESTTGRKFCATCGSPLTSRCPKCGADSKPTSKFCEECGAALASHAAPAATSSTQAASTTPNIRVTPEQPAGDPLDGERKTVTALFADIKGSTELMRDLDPEEARAIVDPVLHLMMSAVHRYGGYVAQSTGDGIFALFGAPIAHEDHPQRALHAALAMQEELRRYSDRLRADSKIPVEARVGVNTGEVVVRTIETGGHTEYTPVGHVTNLAARMQTAAPAGSIAASEATQRLCEGYFEFRALGPTAVKGLNAPVEVYEVVRAGAFKTHFELSARRGLTRFVGREREMAGMAGALEQAMAGHGQIVAAVGEAGAGKSRLFYEFKSIYTGRCIVLEAYSVSHAKVSA